MFEHSLGNQGFGIPQTFQSLSVPCAPKGILRLAFDTAATSDRKQGFLSVLSGTLLRLLYQYLLLHSMALKQDPHLRVSQTLVIVRILPTAYLYMTTNGFLLQQ